MTRETQYDPKLIKAYLMKDVNLSNKELYVLCNATTSAQKNYIRKAKSRFFTSQKKTRENSSNLPIQNIPDGKFTKITEENIEALIMSKLNKNPDNQTIRLAIEYLKLKRTESGLEDDLDIEKYLKSLVIDGDITLIE